MPFTQLSSDDKKILLDIARQSIAYGMEHRRPLPVDVQQYSDLLQSNGASFVTLEINHQLRGCIGTLEAYQPLVKDVADHAFAAAFQDPRFMPVSMEEIDQLDIHISILTAARPMEFRSEDDLISQLRPGIDGLILEIGAHKGTFLPSVWESLPNPRDFLRHLKQKAGLSPEYWSDDIKVSRYTTVSIP